MATPAVVGEITEATAHRHADLHPLTLAALGVVYGDIGTSPLYTIREAFGEAGGDLSACGRWPVVRMRGLTREFRHR